MGLTSQCHKCSKLNEDCTCYDEVKIKVYSESEESFSCTKDSLQDILDESMISTIEGMLIEAAKGCKNSTTLHDVHQTISHSTIDLEAWCEERGLIYKFYPNHDSIRISW